MAKVFVIFFYLIFTSMHSECKQRRKKCKMSGAPFFAPRDLRRKQPGENSCARRQTLRLHFCMFLLLLLLSLMLMQVGFEKKLEKKSNFEKLKKCIQVLVRCTATRSVGKDSMTFQLIIRIWTSYEKQKVVITFRQIFIEEIKHLGRHKATLEKNTI